MRYKYAAGILAIRNDFCLEETINELFKQGVSEVLVVSPTRYWADETEQSRADFDEVAAIIKRTGAYGQSATFKAESAIHTEALYRNHMLRELFDNDTTIDYVLTVDADELWLPGTLEQIDALANPGPLTICLPGVPVIGVPGLPVSGAKDNILVASSRGVEFEWGRSTKGVRAMGSIPVLHFSATRRTMEEMVDKCLKSAHYPDPSYDFDGWIKYTLPNVHVGKKNVHMYRSPENIWPEVRAWTAAELAAIPTTLHPYLKLS
jgi:hypothetical protein